MAVHSSTSDEDSYQCQVTCRTRVEGQRAFEMVQCVYGLSRGAEDRVVCSVKAKSGRKFTEIAQSNTICSPR